MKLLFTPNYKGQPPFWAAAIDTFLMLTYTGIGIGAFLFSVYGIEHYFGV